MFNKNQGHGLNHINHRCWIVVCEPLQQTRCEPRSSVVVFLVIGSIEFHILCWIIHEHSKTGVLSSRIPFRTKRGAYILIDPVELIANCVSLSAASPSVTSPDADIIFSEGMSHQGRSDYTLLVDFENYVGPFFKNNKIVFFIVPKEWFHNIHQTIKKLFSAQFNNKLKIKDNNENDYEIIPYGLTMHITEFRSSCRINHYNCNDFSCHTCDKPRGVDYLLKEGNFRNQKDIIDFHNSKPNKQDFSNPQNKIRNKTKNEKNRH
ncbi:hypothetical protein DDB_G0267336 [Dictyostelium discoideum AX4]|uniref:Uncharacterized protein n=1 Tax=Dictyostelium discoideum TaxID=44689 RepID=Q55GY7_DICDI|nr:hypothetical protein DDB_G0267336 [Dictyostelium discoideum AX4]EAL73774.1 hypothetical protein DDB_G0267336 [Dictyostelium discoideum AX4]|eukprot:XP_647700.1 hypothetical protein DDB_G0267336 [Dictyostelium discoideum AX4]